MDERSSEEMHNNVHDLGEAKKMFHLLGVLDGKREKGKGKRKKEMGCEWNEADCFPCYLTYIR